VHSSKTVNAVGDARAALEDPANAVAAAQAHAQQHSVELETLKTAVKDLVASIKAQEMSGATLGHRSSGGIPIKCVTMAGQLHDSTTRQSLRTSRLYYAAAVFIQQHLT
jgi:hypothetical protein